MVRIWLSSSPVNFPVYIFKAIIVPVSFSVASNTSENAPLPIILPISRERLNFPSALLSLDIDDFAFFRFPRADDRGLLPLLGEEEAESLPLLRLLLLPVLGLFPPLSG